MAPRCRPNTRTSIHGLHRQNPEANVASVLCSPAAQSAWRTWTWLAPKWSVGLYDSCGNTFVCDALLLLEHLHEVLPGEVGALVHLLVALEGLVLHRGQAPQREGDVVGGHAELLAGLEELGQVLAGPVEAGERREEDAAVRRRGSPRRARR